MAVLLPVGVVLSSRTDLAATLSHSMEGRTALEKLLKQYLATILPVHVRIQY